ncbi:hypothetical protein HMN09_01197000 [Mycena chlorophos]|uniref:Protein kinase domain-containing protein n=1 Tax=Mycena chlorophos TaxID=658473 RepID=A0A8H6S6P5_MYCCL|nr:hypothetical protein HMN09_01197000 [Mycena chlorophos]
MPPKRPPAALPPLLDLTSLVVVDSDRSDIILDGRKRKRASSFAVDVLCDAFEGGRERCFLKIFPSDPANTLNFHNECKANHALFGPTIDLKVHLQQKTPNIPLCYGYLMVPDPFYEPPRPQKTKSKAKPAPPPMLNALLFELYDGLRSCDPADLDDPGVMQGRILRVLERIHDKRVLHRDLQDRDSGEPVILDFDHAVVVGETAKELEKLETERTEFEELLKTAVEQKGKERGWGLSREVQRLLN